MASSSATAPIECFNENELEQLSKALAEAATGSELTALLRDARLLDIQREAPQGVSLTKWRRVDAALRDLHNRDQSANGILAFAKRVLAPARFVGKHAAEHGQALSSANVLLALKGVQIRPDGELIRVAKSSTVSEAQQRADHLRSELRRRNVHHEVLRFCRAELLDKDYFHAVLEATKSLGDKLRILTGLASDTAELVDQALSKQRPYLVWNTLLTQSEQSVHTAICMMLKGVFSYYRNPTAHEPRILKEIGEAEALEALTTISFLHRKLEDAQRTSLCMQGPWRAVPNANSTQGHLCCRQRSKVFERRSSHPFVRRIG